MEATEKARLAEAFRQLADLIRVPSSRTVGAGLALPPQRPGSAEVSRDEGSWRAAAPAQQAAPTHPVAS